MIDKRCSGVLMPISSLPSPYGIGTLGKTAYQFIDKLNAAKVKIWQVLPLLPTGYGDSPYQAPAADALNYYFIDLDILCEEKLLKKSDFIGIDWGDNPNKVDYGKMFEYRAKVLKIAYSRFNKESEEWKDFLEEKKYADFAAFMTFKCNFGYQKWQDWGDYAIYNTKKVNRFLNEHALEYEFWQFTQFLFLKQWKKLKNYAKEKDISIMGDMPIYLSSDSVEAWKYRKELFALDDEGKISLVAGVPPDAFSSTGQLWGNPVYNWEKMRQNNYRWWKRRIDRGLELFDILRIDHFRGFDRFYAIPVGASNAIIGEWIDGPKSELFKGREKKNIVAEDLGIIDDGVRKLMKDVGYPGMKVFSFAFDYNPNNEHLPSLYNKNIVAYTGTHDNDPFKGFIEHLNDSERTIFNEKLKSECKKLKVVCRMKTINDQCHTAIRLVFASKANTVIVPLHDVACLDSSARINIPSDASGNNWTFRFTKKQLSNKLFDFLKLLTNEYTR